MGQCYCICNKESATESNRGAVDLKEFIHEPTFSEEEQAQSSVVTETDEHDDDEESVDGYR